MFGAINITKEEMLKGLKYPMNHGDDEIATAFEDFTESIRTENGVKIGNLQL
jgi:hypothetical protein